MNSTALVPGSLGAIAQHNGTSIAESFLSANCIIICDTSASMSATDSRGGKSRYEVELEELTRLQSHQPGKICVISFSSTVMFCPAGTPTNLYGGTNLAGALDFAKVADVPGMRFVVISDGCADDESAALAAARRYKSKH